jgi:hypothetical protein
MIKLIFLILNIKMSINSFLLASKIIYFICSFLNLIVMLLYTFTNIYNSKIINKKNNNNEFKNYLYLITSFYASIFAFSIAIFFVFNSVFIIYWFNLMMVFGVIGTIAYYYYLTKDISIVDNYPLILLICFTSLMLIAAFSVIILYYKTKDPLVFYKDYLGKEQYNKKKQKYSDGDVPISNLRNDASAAQDTLKKLLISYKDSKNVCEFLINNLGGSTAYFTGDPKHLDVMHNEITSTYKCDNLTSMKLTDLLANKYNNGNSEEENVTAAKGAIKNLLDAVNKYDRVF